MPRVEYRYTRTVDGVPEQITVSSDGVQYTRNGEVTAVRVPLPDDVIASTVVDLVLADWQPVDTAA